MREPFIYDDRSLTLLTRTDAPRSESLLPWTIIAILLALIVMIGSVP
jgi:hypothetical protein